jgi:hypothetical protein
VFDLSQGDYANCAQNGATDKVRGCREAHGVLTVQVIILQSPPPTLACFPERIESWILPTKTWSPSLA